MGQLLSAEETHNQSTHFSHNPAPPTTRPDGFLWATTSSCCCNARSSSSSSSSSTCCCNILYRAKITPVQAVIFWRRLPTLQQQQSSSPVRHTHMKVNLAAAFGQICPLSGHTSRSCTGGSVRGTNQGKNVMLPASRRRQGLSSVHPQRFLSLIHI